MMSMKTILKIAKAELSTLFYSPIAWLILIIFAFQAGLTFSDLISAQLRYQSLGYHPYNLTSRLLLGYSGVFGAMQKNLFLYIPLLTMGLMSREYSSGSIKLLYSSPITNFQIIFGKYLSMLVYAFVLTGILLVCLIFTACVVKSFDYSFAFTGLAGIFLLICAYAAIGLFMSTLTSYQVVAAVGTLTLLAILNFVGNVGQDIAFVRDITYWLSISGRSTTLLEGLICSEDVLYFIIVVILFVWLSVLKLRFARKSVGMPRKVGSYLLVVCAALFVGYLSSRPTLMAFYDATATKSNTLTPNSQAVMKKLEGGLSITTYVNLLDEGYSKGLPEYVNYDKSHFKRYVRFKPEIKMDYVYYYDKVYNPSLYGQYPNMTEEEIAKKRCDILDLDPDMFLSPEEVRKQVDLSGEGNRFVRLVERENGQRAFLRLFDDNQRDPNESEITAALKRMVVKAPKVAFLKGHGERDIHKGGDRDYAAFAQNLTFRYSLVNQGFDVVTLSLEDQAEVPADLDIIVIADAKEPFSAEEMEKLYRYIDRGGNLIIAGEPRRQEIMNPVVEKLGVRFMPGTVVQPSDAFVADLIVGNVTEAAGELVRAYASMHRNDYKIVMPGAVGLEYTEDKGFNVTPMIVTNATGAWEEVETTDFIDDKPVVNPEVGEKEQTLPLMLYLTRQVGDKEQRILVLGDADCISNGELLTDRHDINASNFTLITESFRSLSYGEFPVDTSRPRPVDDKLYLGQGALIWVKILFMGLIPAVLLFFSLMTWMKRRRK